MPEVQANPASSSVAKSSAEDTSPRSPGSDTSGSTAARKSGTKTKGALFIVIALAVSAAGIFLLRPSGSSGGASGDTAAEVTLPLETFVVNVEGGGQRAYLRVGITLGLSHQARRTKKEDVPIALVRDAVLSVLAGAQSEQLITSEGKQKLKAELLKVLQERAPDLGVENVYFTEFLVQM